MTEYIEDIPMNLDYETEWLPVIIERIDGIRRRFVAKSVQIWWQAVAGLMNGRIEILGTNETTVTSFIIDYVTSSNTNTNNAELYVFIKSFNYFKIRYSKNGNISGKFSLAIMYD